MKTYSKIILMLICFLFFQKANSQEIFKIKDNFTSINFDEHINVYSTTDSIFPKSLLENDISWEENKISYGFSKSFYWLRFSIQNDSDTSKQLYFEVDNPHLRFIEFYKVEENDVVLKYKCGRHMPFDVRPIDNVRFIFPINLAKNEKGNYFVKVDKRLSSISFPTKLWNKNEFTKMYNKINLLNGIYFGGLLLAAIYSLFAFFYLKRRLYLYYFLYVIFVGFYVFTSVGYSFQYIIKNSFVFNSYARVICLVFTVFFHAKFIQTLLNTNVNVKKLHRTINILASSLLLLMVVWLFFDPFYKKLVTNYLKITYLLILILIILFIWISIVSYKKKKRIAKLYLLSFSAILIAGIWLLLQEYNWFPFSRPDISPLYFGSFFEVLILSVTLISEMLLVLKEKEELTMQVAEKQQEIIQAYVDGIEKEKLRISEELHDDIGSKLSNLNRFISSEDAVSNKTRSKIENIINDVRNISHKLSPNKSIFSFKEQIENVVEESLSGSEIDYKLYQAGKYQHLSDDQKLNVYRIVQEFLQNTIKHSRATFVEIQLTKIDDNLILTIEDNGIGFDTKEKKKGLGLTNIQRRVDYLNGKLELSSIQNKGTYMVVSIPV